MRTENIQPASNILPSLVLTWQQVRPGEEEKAPLQAKEKATDSSHSAIREEKYTTNVAIKVNEMVTVLNNHLAFSVDEKTGKRIIEVVDSETKEVIRQIPPEEILRALAGITDMLGSWIDEKV